MVIDRLEERTLLSVCTWDGGGGNNNWYNPDNWVGDIRPNPGDDLVFSGTTQTATNNNYGAGTQFGSITINNDNFSLAGNSIQLAGGITAVSGATNLTIGLNLTFANNSIITAASGAELAISGSVSFTSKQLFVQGEGETIFSGALSGQDFRTNANGTATFVGASTLNTPAFVIAGSGSTGTINWNSTGNLNTNALYVGFGGLGYINQNKGWVITGSPTYGLNMCYSGSTYHIEHFEGTPGVLSTASVYTNAPGTIEFAGGRLNATSSFTIDANVSYNLATDWAYFDTKGYNVTVEGDFSGSGNLIKCYTGSLTLNGSDSHTGVTRIANGSLVLGNSLALKDSTLFLYSGDSGSYSFGSLTSATFGGLAGSRNLTLENASSAAVALTVGNNDGSTTYSGVLGGPGSLTKIGSGTLTITNDTWINGGTTISEGEIQVGDGGTSGTICRCDIQANGTLAINLSSGFSIGCDISGSGTLIQRGTGRFGLFNANSFTGTTRIVSGTFVIEHPLALQYSTLDMNVGDAGVLSFDSYTTSATLGALTGSRNISLQNTASNAVALTVGNNNADATYSGVLSGTGSLIKTGTGTLTLGGANTYSGATAVNAGTLQIGNANAIPSGAGKENVLVAGVLDLNGHSVTVNGLSGTGTITSSIAGGAALTVGGNNQTSSFSGRIEDGEGVVALTKIGTGTVTFADTQTYTGDTTVTAGTLNVLGNLNSHIIEDGGTVTNTIFYDPHVASAVRETLGLDPDAVMTINDVAQLTSLCLNSNLAFSLQGLEYATNLESLTLVPGDYAADMETLSDLSPLMNLDNLTTLVLQGCDLTDAALATLSSDSVQPDALESLDVRYNLLNSVPVEISDYLPSLASLYIHGNSAIADDPTTGLTNLAGKLVNIDLEPNNPEEAATIEDLAEALYYLPIEMYEYVLNTIEYQAYSGAMKGALAVLQTGAGNDWDTAALLAELFDEAGVSAYYVSGTIRVPDEEAMLYLGVLDDGRAVEVLNAADLNASQSDGNITFDHTWLQTTIDSATYYFDPSWKFRDFQDGLGNMLSAVPFDYTTNGDYLSEIRVETSVEYYAQHVRDYLADNYPSLTIADVAYDGPIHQQAVDSLPTSLPYTVTTQDAPVASIPSAYTHRVAVSLSGGGRSFNWSDSLPDICLSRLTIDPNVSGDNAQPRLLLDGVQVAICNGQISKDADTTITITHYYGASQVGQPSVYSRTASDYIAVGLDANQTSDQMLVDAWSAVNDAQISKVNSGTPTNDELIGSLLYLDAMTYYHRLNQSAELVAGLTASVPVYNFVGSCLVTSTTDLHATHDMDQQVPYRPKWMVIDVQNGNPYHQTPIAASDSYRVMRYNLLGYASSALESTVWESIVNISSTSTIQSLQYANEESISIAEFDADDNLNAITTALAAIDNSYPNYLRDYIAGEIDTWVHTVYEDWVFTAIIPTDETPVGDNPQWNGVGCILCVNGYAASYMIYGVVTGSSQSDMIMQGGWAGGSQNPVGEIYVTLNSNTEGDPIDTANGDVVHEMTDISIENLGYTLEFSRKYDSYNVDGSGDSDRGQGEGWSFTYSDCLEFDGGSAIWFNDEGIRFTFASDGMGGYVTPDTIFGDLVYNGVGYGYTWTDSSGNTVTFDDAGRLVQRLDRYDNGVDITYVGSTTHIYQVTDHVTPARCLTFTYTGDYITSIADFSGRTWTYAYTSNRLTSVTTPSDGSTAQQVTAYAYYTDTARAGLLQTITYPDSTTINYAYYANRRGFQVTDSNGNTDTMLYNLYNLGDSEDTNFGRTTYIDRLGTASRYTYDENGYLTEVRYSDWTTEVSEWTDGMKTSAIDAYGQAEHFLYDSDGNLTKYTCPAGYVTNYTYTTDGYNNVDTITYTNDLEGQYYNADLVIDYNYDGLGRLTERIDDAGGLNYHTVYAYDGAGGSRGLPDSVTTPNGYLTAGDPNDYKTAYTYNNAGQILTTTTRTSATNSITKSYTYDSVGNLLTFTDGEGNVTTNTYDLLNRVLTITYPDPDGAGGLPAPHETYTYNSAGLLETVTVDTSGINPLVTSYTYDDMWRKTRIEYADGTYVSYDYDQDGNLLSETDELGNATRYVYDDRGRMFATVFPDDGVEQIAFDGGSRAVAKTDALGNMTRYEYDLLGRVVKITDAEGGETEYAYDAPGSLHTVTDPLDNVTTYDYDNLRRLVTLTETDPDGGGALTSPVIEYDYDANSNLISVTDPRDYETTYDYDEADRQIAVNLPDPDGAGPLGILTTSYQYDDNGNLVKITDPLSNETLYDYDHLDRLVMVTEPDPDGGGPLTSPVTEYDYDAYGNQVAVTDPLDHATTYQYNLIGQLTSLTDALGNTTSYLYDAAGNLIRLTEPLTDEDVLSAYALGATTEYVYDSMDRLVLQTDAEGGKTSYIYDAAGNLLTLTDPEENATNYAYDGLNRLVEETNELSDTQYNIYNDAGLLVRAIDREGRVIVYEYDDLYRNTFEIWYNNVTDADADQNRLETISYTYDAAGNLLTASDNYATYAYEYDGLGRVVEETQTIAGLSSVIVLTYEYDAVGNMIQAAMSIGGTADAVTDYTYDNLGRVTMVEQHGVQGGNAVSEKRIDITYDDASQYATITRYADLAGTDLVATATYTFDDAYRLIGLDYAKGVNTLVEHGWTYDDAGRITQYINSIDGTVDYTYDYTNQLTDADYDYQTDESYTYDENGNRTNAGYVTGGNNQLLSDGTYRYSYDTEGNREFRYVDADSSGTLNSGDTDITEYQWDHRNRLIEVEHFTTYAHYYAGTSDQIVQYAYDYANRLIRRMFDPDGTGGATAVEQSVYVYEGNQIVTQFDKTGTGDLAATDMSHRYMWNPQAVDQLFTDEQVHYDGGFVTDELLWALTDRQQNVRDLAEYNAGTDQTTIALHRVFDAFGNVTSETGAAECLFGYTGKLYDEATDLQNNLNRWYDPAVGRFVSEDPIGYLAGDPNIYRYVGNDPVSLTDPAGLCKDDTEQPETLPDLDGLADMLANVGQFKQFPPGRRAQPGQFGPHPGGPAPVRRPSGWPPTSGFYWPGGRPFGWPYGWPITPDDIRELMEGLLDALEEMGLIRQLPEGSGEGLAGILNGLQQMGILPSLKDLENRILSSPAIQAALQRFGMVDLRNPYRW